MITNPDEFPREKDHMFSNNPVDRMENTLGEETQKAILAAMRSHTGIEIDEKKEFAVLPLDTLPYLAGYISSQIRSYLKAFPEGHRNMGR